MEREIIVKQRENAPARWKLNRKYAAEDVFLGEFEIDGYVVDTFDFPSCVGNFHILFSSEPSNVSRASQISKNEFGGVETNHTQRAGHTRSIHVQSAFDEEIEKLCEAERKGQRVQITGRVFNIDMQDRRKQWQVFTGWHDRTNKCPTVEIDDVIILKKEPSPLYSAIASLIFPWTWRY